MIKYLHITSLFFLFVLQSFLFYKKYDARGGLLVFTFNLAAVCCGGLLFPFYGNSAIFTIFIFLVIVNLAILLAPRRLVKRISTALYNRPFLQKFVLAVLSIIIFFGGIEWTAQVLTKHEVIKYYYPKRTQVREGTEDWRIAHITADEFHEPDPVLFWRPVARHPYNSQGFKGPEVAVLKPDNVFRIICYGDSNTEGLPESSWPEELQKVLDRENISGEWKYEVINAGVAGYSSYQGLMRFRQEVGVYEPDLIFVSFGWNDLPIAVDAPDKQFQPPHPLLVFPERILLKYRFYLSLKYYLKKIRKPFEANSNSQPRVSLQDYVMNLNGFLNTAKKYGVLTVLLTRPHKKKAEEVYEISPWEIWRTRVPLYNEALLKLAKSKGVLVIDVQKIFEARPDLFGHECHLTFNGQKKMAIIVYKELLKNNCLPPAENELLARISHE